MKIVAKLWIGIAVLIVLSALGLILPRYFKAGSAWGEWGTDELQKLVGYVPEGLKKLSSLWSAPIADYAFKGRQETSLGHLSLSYIASGVVGIVVIIAVALLVGKTLTKKGDN
jgi:hypothetical protein